MNRLRGVIVVAAAALVLTACQSPGTPRPVRSSSPASGTASSPAPTISLADARTTLATYVSTNNTANHTLDSGLLATVEGGGLYQQSAAQMRQEPTWTASEQTLYRKPFDYLHPQYIRPSGVSWWAVEATGTGARPSVKNLLVFDRDASGRWKMVAAVATDAGEALPALAPATAVSPAPGVRADITDVYVTGGARAGAGLAASPAKSWMHAMWADNSKKYDARIAVKVVAAPTSYRTEYALRTADGGQLMVLNTGLSVNEYSLQAGYLLNPGPLQRLYIGSGKRREIETACLDQSAVFVSRTGRARVLGSAMQPTGAHGQP